MPAKTKPKAKAKPKAVAKTSPEKLVQKPSPVKPPAPLPRLDQKDYRSQEEKDVQAQASQPQPEEVVVKGPPVSHEVPHIDIPIIEKEDTMRPAWHAIDDDVPSFAKPTVSSVPAPIPPSQVLSSAPPPHMTSSEQLQPVEGTHIAQSPDKNVPSKPETLKPKPHEQKHPQLQSKSNVFLFLFAGIVVGVLVLLGVFVFYFKISTVIRLPFATRPLDTPQDVMVTSTPAPTAPDVLTLDRSTVIFDVLNGSGVKGAAANAAGKLEEAGYMILTTGNAPSAAIVTEIYLRDTLTQHQETIVADIKEFFTEATYAGVLADDDTTASARLIVGKK